MLGGPTIRGFEWRGYSTIGEQERDDVGILGIERSASFDFAEIVLDLCDVEVCVILCSGRLEGPSKSLAADPEAKDEIPDALSCQAI